MMAQAGLQAPSPAELLAAVAASVETSFAEDEAAEARIQQRRFDPESNQGSVSPAPYSFQESDQPGRQGAPDTFEQTEYGVQEEYVGQEYDEAVAEDEYDDVNGVAKGKGEAGGVDATLSFGSKEAAIASSLLALETASHLLELEQQREDEAQEEAERDMRMNGERLFEEEQASVNGGYSSFHLKYGDPVHHAWVKEELDEKVWAPTWRRGPEDEPASPRRGPAFLPPGGAEPLRGRRSDKRRPRRFVEPLELVWKVPETEAEGARPKKPKRQKRGEGRARNSSLSKGSAPVDDWRLARGEGGPQRESSQGPEFEEDVIVSDPHAPLGLPLARVKRLMKESAKECHASSMRRAVSAIEASLRQGGEATGNGLASSPDLAPTLAGRGALKGAEPAKAEHEPGANDNAALCLDGVTGDREGGSSGGRHQEQQQQGHPQQQGSTPAVAATHPASISTEAAHIMTKATELFLMKFAHSTARTMLKADDGRSSLLYRHVGGTVASEGYLSFLADLVPQKVKLDQIQPFSFLPGAWTPPTVPRDHRAKEHHGSPSAE